MTLLIADDDAGMRALVRSTLAPDLPDAIEASDGRELFWHLMRASFGVGAREDKLVLVVDVRMPAYNGLDVLESWHDRKRDVPIIVITSFPDERTRKRVARLSATLVEKPFARATLRQAVLDATKRAREA